VGHMIRLGVLPKINPSPSFMPTLAWIGKNMDLGPAVLGTSHMIVQ
jgi:hypothetical protein